MSRRVGGFDARGFRGRGRFHDREPFISGKFALCAVTVGKNFNDAIQKAAFFESPKPRRYSDQLMKYITQFRLSEADAPSRNGEVDD